MKRGVAGKMLRGEIKESEVPEVWAGRIIRRDEGTGEKIRRGQLQHNVGVGAGGHREIEAEGRSCLMKIEDVRGLCFGLEAAAAKENEGNLPLSVRGGQPQIGE